MQVSYYRQAAAPQGGNSQPSVSTSPLHGLVATTANRVSASQSALPANGLSLEQLYKPSPLHRPLLNVKFGLIHPFCGVCPVCMAGVAAQSRLDQVKKMREGDDSTDLLNVQVGQGSDFIRQEGTRGSGARLTYIGNEDGTRVQPMAQPDYQAFRNALLPRDYASDGKSFTIQANPASSMKGLENGLYKLLVEGLALSKTTNSYPIGDNVPQPPLLPDLIENADKHPKAFGLYHHISEGPQVAQTKRSFPLLVGYASAAKLKDRELLVPSIREMPTMEGLGAEAGGIMNILGMATLSKKYDAVTVLVEPWQKDVKAYLDILKDEHGIDVKELSAVARVGTEPMPNAYLEFMNRLNLPSDTTMYRVPLDVLKENLKTVDPNQPDGNKDTDLLRTIQLPDPERKNEAMRVQQLDRTIYPRLHELAKTLFRHLPKPDYKELQDEDIPAKDLEIPHQ